MEFLKPEIIVIKDRYYRKLPIRKDLRNPEEDDLYPNEMYDAEDNEDTCDVDIRTTGDGFCATICVPGALMHAFAVKSRVALQRETKTSITTLSNVQLAKDDTIEILIKGKEKNGIARAYHRIEYIMETARWRTNFTHFVSFPMNFSNLKESFLKFKADVLTNCRGSRGLSESLFQDPNKLHLTVVPLVLLDNREREKAKSILQKSRNEINKIIKGQPLKVFVKGIEIMNDDPSEVDVLYAKVQDCGENECLQIVADVLQKKFMDAKLARKERDSVKLHITLINTTFRSEDVKSPKPQNDADSIRNMLQGKKRISFDASKIMKNYEDYEFGHVIVKEIHISVRHTKAEDGFYIATSELKLQNQ